MSDPSTTHTISIPPIDDGDEDNYDDCENDEDETESEQSADSLYSYDSGDESGVEEDEIKSNTDHLDKPENPPYIDYYKLSPTDQHYEQCVAWVESRPNSEWSAYKQNCVSLGAWEFLCMNVCNYINESGITDISVAMDYVNNYVFEH